VDFISQIQHTTITSSQHGSVNLMRRQTSQLTRMAPHRLRGHVECRLILDRGSALQSKGLALKVAGKDFRPGWGGSKWSAHITGGCCRCSPRLSIRRGAC